MENTMNKRGFFKSFFDGLYLRNPVLSLCLGLTLAVLVTNKLDNALILSAIVVVVMVLTNLLISALRKLIDKVGAIMLAVLFSAGIASLLYLLLDRGVPGMDGIFMENYSSLLIAVVPFVATTSAVIVKSQEVIDRPFLDTLGDTLGSAIGFAFALCLIAFCREALSTGALSFSFNYENPLVVTLWDAKVFKLGLMGEAFGGFLVTGLLCGLHMSIVYLIQHKALKKEEK